MKRYSIYWTVTIKEKNGEVHETTKSCDVIASNFVKAAAWLNNNKEDFDLECLTSVYSYNNVNLAE